MGIIIVYILLGFLGLLILTMLAQAFLIRSENGDTVAYVKTHFGITITRTQADWLNDHRARDENMLRVSGDQVLVKTKGGQVELRTLT